MRSLTNLCIQWLIRKLNKRVDPIWLIESLTEGRFRFFDVSRLDAKRRQNYAIQARNIIESAVWRNEVARYKAECADWALKNSQDFQGVRDMRMSVSAIEAIEVWFVELAAESTQK